MDNIKRFENQPIRTAWDEEKEEWYFSVSDVVEILSESKDVKQYIKKMRSRDPELNSKWGTICTPVRMMTADGKNRKINAADTEGILRIIQSIPSKKAEPFKMWLAQVGRERIEEIIDPELTIERALDTYAKKGYPADWINQRLQTIRARKELTDQWQAHGVEKGKEYAILTDEVTKAWSGMTTRQYKNLKGLKKENLRDNITQNPYGLEENREVAQSGGKIAGDARKNIEAQTGKPVITSDNAARLNEVVTGMIERVVSGEESNE
ncbi:Bro-N domain-containing protein [uncultured Ruminococcus sp.]|uniref:BRO-N domain-containing protein n=1 Tax=uncultured Ruminococcus sp. TaxID=165186 RepID=UPI00292E41DE|nr:Bro-N domain-containing protein [uncultured Ruminococcus sp.]